MKTDYLIIGQGICGSLLSRELLAQGAAVKVIDSGYANSSSRVASGLINPVTGKRLVKSWMIDDFLPVALSAYRYIGETIGMDILRQTSILDFHTDAVAREVFDQRDGVQREYLSTIDDTAYWQQFFSFHWGAGSISPCWLVDLSTMLGLWRKALQGNGALLEDVFDLAQCRVSEGEIQYREITARKIIFCDGVAAFNNPYFSKLPFSKNKGQVILARIQGLPEETIYKHGLKMVPLGKEVFWIGSSFEWKYEDALPTENFRNHVVSWLKGWMKLPYEIIDHKTAERPSTVDYRPFVGFHPKMTSVGILNGMGSKGCSQAPFFAKQIAAALLEGTGILPDADIRRFTRALSR